MVKKVKLTNVNHAWNSAMKENGMKSLILLGDDYLKLLESHLTSLTFGMRDYQGLTGQLLDISMALEVENDRYSLAKKLYLGKQNRITDEDLVALTKAKFDELKEVDVSVNFFDGTWAPLDTFVYQLFTPENANNAGLLKQIIRESFNRVVEVHLSKEISTSMFDKSSEAE